MRLHPIAAVIVLGMIPASAMGQAAKTAAASLENHNLIKNGTAEVPTDDSKKVPAWGQHDGLTEVEYGSAASEWDWGLSGCGTCGQRYLRLAFEGDTHELSVSQTVDVAALAIEIDKKTVTATVSAYLGGFKDSDTTGQVVASFQDASGSELGKIETPPYDTKQLPKREKGSTGLTPCQASGSVSAGTRKIAYTWKANSTGTSGDYLGLGDNLSLVLAAAQR
jgi:hypothetical protein